MPNDSIIKDNIQYRDDFKQVFQEVCEREKDPNGINQHAPGAKLDSGKPMVGLVLGDFSQALYQVSQVGTIGAKKYSKHGWCKVDDGFNRYTDAMLRHWLAEARGETFDKDTEMLHAAQVAWNALARLELLIKELLDGE